MAGELWLGFGESLGCVLLLLGCFRGDVVVVLDCCSLEGGKDPWTDFEGIAGLSRDRGF